MIPGAVGKGGSRNRWIYGLLTGATIAVGLFVRSPWAHLPSGAAKYGGVALYAVMVFWLAGWAFKSRSTRTVALVAVAFCWAIELGQLVRTPEIDELRRTVFGVLVLGSGFSWWDVGTYAVGVLVAGLAEQIARGRNG